MKIIVLASEKNSFLNNKPLCLSKFNSISILERLLRSLIFFGYKSEDILIVYNNSSGKDDNSKLINKIKQIHSFVLFQEGKTSITDTHSLLMGIEYLDIKDNFLVIDGDIILRKDISKLIAHGLNQVVTHPVLSVQQKDRYVYVKRGKVIGTNTVSTPEDFSFCRIFGGIIAFDSTIIPSLSTCLKCHFEKDLLYIVGKLCDVFNFYNVDYSGMQSEVNKRKFSYTELVGGSYASLKKMVIVRKEANGHGTKKLANEIKWLTNLDENKKKYFPEIYRYQCNDKSVFFDMPYYNLPNLRELIMVGDFGVKESSALLKKVFDFMFEEVYSHTVSPSPRNWLKTRFFDRINLRLIDSIKIYPPINKFIEAKKIIINNIEYQNLNEILCEIAKRNELIDYISSKTLCMVHGDLHFQNILVDRRNIELPFKLMDPRGDIFGSSIYYDLGKIWHSVNGLYDFFHTGQFNLKWREDKNIIIAKIDFDNFKALTVYSLLKKEIVDILSNYNLINNDENWLMKMTFYEMAHFASLIPFHLENNCENQKGLSMYLMAVKLFNEFWNRINFEEWKITKNSINVKDFDQYKKECSIYSSIEEDTYDYIYSK